MLHNRYTTSDVDGSAFGSKTGVTGTVKGDADALMASYEKPTRLGEHQGMGTDFSIDVW